MKRAPDSINILAQFHEILTMPGKGKRKREKEEEEEEIRLKRIFLFLLVPGMP